jgi:hypothetical protein
VHEGDHLVFGRVRLHGPHSNAVGATAAAPIVRRAAPSREGQTQGVDRSELRGWIEDALTRHDRDTRERAEPPGSVTVEEVIDAVWGRLPLAIRRQTTRAQVQASLTMLTLRHGIAMTRDEQPRPTHTLES